MNGGIRWEALNAQVEAAESPAGRFVPARHFDAIENLPDWSDWAPRFVGVYDLFGNAKTALKFSLNRYNQARTTGIAGGYNALAVADGDAHLDRSQQRRHRAGRARLRLRHARALHVGLRNQLRGSSRRTSARLR